MERITTPALAQKFIDEQITELRAQIGDKKVLLALSGGVDSSVVAALLIKAVGKQLVSVHVNHGLLRKGEPEQVVRVFRDELDANLVYVDATDRFLEKVAGVADPEQKRKIIGAEFIRVFEEEARKLEGISFLAQGTIYPDIVESGPVKSHHNVGGLPEDMKFELVEPIKLLYKDEVRMVGKALGLPDNMVFRQPFPGPGLGVRCTGAITRDRLEALRESDAILREEFAKNGLEGKVWQYFTIVPDYKSTGVKDNKRSWDWPVIIRAVNTRDAMTATIEEIPYELLHHITKRIITEVPGVNRVLYDLTPKRCVGYMNKLRYAAAVQYLLNGFQYIGSNIFYVGYLPEITPHLLFGRMFIVNCNHPGLPGDRCQITRTHSGARSNLQYEPGIEAVDQTEQQLVTALGILRKILRGLLPERIEVLICIIGVALIDDVFYKVICPGGVYSEPFSCQPAVFCKFHYLFYFSTALMDVPVPSMISSCIGVCLESFVT